MAGVNVICWSLSLLLYKPPETGGMSEMENSIHGKGNPGNGDLENKPHRFVNGEYTNEGFANDDNLNTRM